MKAGSSSYLDQQFRLGIPIYPPTYPYLLSLPLCPLHGLPIRQLCLSSDCFHSAFGLCSDQSCVSHHSHPTLELIQLTAFNNIVYNTTIHLSVLLDKAKDYFDTVKQNLLHSLERDIAQMIRIIQIDNLPPVVQMIRSNQIKSITPHILKQYLKKYSLSPPTLVSTTLQRIQTQKNLQKLLQSQEYFALTLKDIYILKNPIHTPTIQSQILTDKEKELLLNFMRQQHVHFNTKWEKIHQASKQQFSMKFYMRDVMNKMPLIILIETDKRRKFGVYLHCALKFEQHWLCDARGDSFIFSIDHGTSMRLKKQKRDKVAYGGKQGILIGSGCDIYLYQGCNSHYKSGANLGGSFILPQNLQFNTTSAQEYLAGESSFRVKQIEVFHLK